MKKIYTNYLNVGCGEKYHNEWTNVDLHSSSPFVIGANLLEGFPFPDQTFDVVYHSQVLEHIPKEKSGAFISECFRVLKPGGTIRVVVPDLENIVNEYQRILKANLGNQTAVSKADYDWIMLEMYDQTVRNYSGGQMAVYLKTPELNNEEYVVGRIGYVGQAYRNSIKLQDKNNLNVPGAARKVGIKRVMKKIYNGFKKLIYQNAETKRIGKFRLGGEIHYWMYDRYSLGRLLYEVGFEKAEVMSSCKSNIPDWEDFELDVKKGMVYNPTSLFMEARKPRSKD